MSDMREENMKQEIRDYFAAKALGGLMANAQWMEEAAKQTNGTDTSLDQVNAKRAYMAADAMLEEREK